MRLLEYQVKKFYDDCLYSNIEKHECAEKGFILAKFINLGMEFWLDSKDCTDEDFVKAVYEENIKKNIIPESELFEILARFLCGYDVYEYFKDDSLRGRVDSKIKDKNLSEKLKFVKNCII